MFTYAHGDPRVCCCLQVLGLCIVHSLTLSSYVVRYDVQVFRHRRCVRSTKSTHITCHILSHLFHTLRALCHCHDSDMSHFSWIIICAPLHVLLQVRVLPCARTPCARLYSARVLILVALASCSMRLPNPLHSSCSPSARDFTPPPPPVRTAGLIATPCP